MKVVLRIIALPLALLFQITLPDIGKSGIQYGAFYSVDISPYGRYIATGWNDSQPNGNGWLRIYDFFSGNIVKSIHTRSTLFDITYSSDGKFLAGAFYHKKEGIVVSVWRTKDWLRVATRRFHGGNLNFKSVLAFSNSASYLGVALGSPDDSILWDFKNKNAKTIPVSGYATKTLWGKNGIAYSDKSSLYSLDVKNKSMSPIIIRTKPYNEIKSLDVGKLGRRKVAAIGSNTVIELWNMDKKKAYYWRKVSSNRCYSTFFPVIAIKINSHRKEFAYYCYGGDIMVHSLKSGELLYHFNEYPYGTSYSDFVFSPNGNYIIIASDTGVIKIVDLNTKKTIRELY